MNALPFFKICAKASIPNHDCKGRITWDHSLMFAGNQVIEPWATVPVCEYGHGVDSYQDSGDRKHDVHVWIALCRATPAELSSISKAIDYHREKTRLIAKYGLYDEKAAIDAYNGKAAKSPVQQDVAIWFPVSREMKHLIDLCIRSEKVHIGTNSSPFEIINRAINEYHQKVEAEVKTLA